MQTVIEIIPFAAGALFLAVLVYLFYIFLPLGNLKFLVIKRRVLQKKIKEDLEKVKIYIDGIENVAMEFDKRAIYFDKKNIEDILPNEKEELLQFWAKYLDYQFALNELIEYYKYFYQINYHFNNRLHVKAFFIGYVSLIASYKNGVKIINYIIKNPSYKKIFNDKSFEYGIDFGMYDKLSNNILHLNDVFKLNIGYENFKFLRKKYKRIGFWKNNKDTFKYVDDCFVEISGKMKENSSEWFSINIFSIFKKVFCYFWFPVQMRVAKQLGEIRFSMRHRNFITKRQLGQMKEEMFPGDIIVQRENWYLSNIGIPGFWPHTALYVGRYRKFVKFFDGDEKVATFLFENGYRNIRDFFRKINNRAYRDFRRGRYDIYEARSPGVIFNRMKHSVRVDYVGVLRPNIEKVEILKAIIYGMKHYGKPYDFKFDFVTDSALVCSELIYKIYQSSLSFKLRIIMGRPLFTATDLVKKFDEDFESDKKELEFVYFLDGIERFKKAVKSDINSFRKTWKRPKWDIVQD